MGIDMVSLENDFKRFDEAMKSDIINAKRQLAEKALERLYAISPVLTGNYLYNHTTNSDVKFQAAMMDIRNERTIEETSVDEGTREARRQAFGKEMLLREKLKLATMKNLLRSITIDNPVPYANALEWGHSPRAPKSKGIYRRVHTDLIDTKIVLDEIVI